MQPLGALANLAYLNLITGSSVMDQPTRRLGESDAEMQMPCPKCGYPMVEAQVGEVVLSPAKRTLGNLLKATTCTARVCSECGFTEFYAKTPRDLLE
jgi:predicted nucleic-acid-binding Zn-ribbon protein